ncbi:MAG: hypothetical protein ABS99_07145 [Acetobacteraceae bacterium SCN 69-10]|nr:universal stress protein [Rhodospirillales bacterium]ODU55646.1 MAG: hypothetical protein ABS99_07145 [Acetobacteraceae bacterium SCN 69-10]OJY72293.1 MAG: hypothetical protein BGP12_12165 [Rhodospirillales bacterium 70-18]
MTAVILVVLERQADAPSLLAAAGRLAGLLGGTRVTALAVRVPAEATIMPTEEILTDRYRQAWDSAEATRLAVLGDAHARWRAEGGEAARRSELRIEQGDPEALVATHGRAADYLVVARPSDAGGGAAREMAHAALFDTGRPVLLVPPGFAGDFGQAIGVAWKDDGRAGKAVLAAMPLLRAARRVCVLAGSRDGAAALPEVLPEILMEHAIPATLRPVPLDAPGGFGAALLREAAEAGIDLLVMGAYAHSAWREMLLGGVTRHVLAAAAIPVLLRH